MALSLSVVQRLLVLCALAWAVFPVWGGCAFGAAWLMLALGTRSRISRARTVLEGHLEPLKALSPEGLALTRRFPLSYVWPSSAEQWGTTWQLSGLLALLLMAAFGVRALVTWTPWFLLLLIPLVVVVMVGGSMSLRLKLGERVRGVMKDQRPLHETTMTLLRLKTTVGQWPPEPSPDPEPDAKEKKK